MAGVVALELVCCTALGAVPAVDELLDKFASNVEGYQSSFAMELESSKTSFVRKTPFRHILPGEHHEYYSTDCRWDGRRLKERKYAWGSNMQGVVTTKEHALYTSELHEATRQLYYSVNLGQRQGAMAVYHAGTLSKAAVWDLVVAKTGAFAWGYIGAGGARIDVFLRQGRNAHVRPQTERVNDANCYIVEARTPEGQYSVWIDPTHGYSMAKLEHKTQDSHLVVSNTAFGQVNAAWMPLRMVFDILVTIPPQHDWGYHQEINVTKLLVNPDHRERKSFLTDDIPPGTECRFLVGMDRLMPGRYVWRDDKPIPSIDGEILAQLDRIAKDLVPPQPDQHVREPNDRTIMTTNIDGDANHGKSASY